MESISTINQGQKNMTSKLPTGWRYQIQQYGSALKVTVPLFIVFSVYLFFRRGYYNLYIANKIFAGVAVVLFGLVLLLGPLSRYFQAFDRYVQYRKELGIVGFFLALFHALVSYFFLPDKFPVERFYTYGLWPFVFGLVATVILIIIFVISNNLAMKALGAQRWWKLQNWGVRIMFVFIALHVFIMKWKDWVNWYKKGGAAELVHPEWPGLGMLVGWFMAAVIVVRISEMFGPRVGRTVWFLVLFSLPIIYFLTFWRGQNFVP